MLNFSVAVSAAIRSVSCRLHCALYELEVTESQNVPLKNFPVEKEGLLYISATDRSETVDTAPIVILFDPCDVQKLIDSENKVQARNYTENQLGIFSSLSKNQCSSSKVQKSEISSVIRLPLSSL